MENSELDLEAAEVAGAAERAMGHAVAARFDRRRARLLVELHTGVEVSVPIRQLEGLANASSEDLAEIEISQSGLGLHWPRLDADLSVPGLLAGIFGSRRWMASLMGQAGGRARSVSKAEAARNNGRKGGRPPRIAKA